jgi:hypothetical protein
MPSWYCTIWSDALILIVTGRILFLLHSMVVSLTLPSVISLSVVKIKLRNLSTATSISAEQKSNMSSRLISCSPLLPGSHARKRRRPHVSVSSVKMEAQMNTPRRCRAGNIRVSRIYWSEKSSSSESHDESSTSSIRPATSQMKEHTIESSIQVTPARSISSKT